MYLIGKEMEMFFGRDVASTKICLGTDNSKNPV